MIKDVADKLVLFFAKCPESGNVKSRLAAELGNETATEIYRCFVLDILDMLSKSGFSFNICFYPPHSADNMKEWLGSEFSYMPQHGRDLGDRMRNALATVFSKGHKYAVVIGSDIPDIPKELIGEALISLETHDAVIGPSFDGGYYLIGFRQDSFLPDAFDGIEWGGEAVFEDTLNILKNRGRITHVLKKWRDVDRHEDIKKLVHENKSELFSGSRTMQYLSEHPEILR